MKFIRQLEADGDIRKSFSFGGHFENPKWRP